MSSEAKPELTIYTDGAAEPNPGHGGYGVVLIGDGKQTECSGGFKWTTNNRMELMAVIVGLETLKQPCRVTVHSDSRYVVNAINKRWVFKWRANGWLKGDKQPALNIDLWKRFLAVCEQHEVSMVWVKGHSGNKGNERCDELATAALKRGDLKVDEGYMTDNAVARLNAEEIRDGEPCRKCGAPVVRKTVKKSKVIEGRCREWSLDCPDCGARYLVEAGMREVGEDLKQGTLWDGV